MSIVNTNSGLKLAERFRVPNDWIVIDTNEILKHNSWDNEIENNFVETGTFFCHGVISALIKGANNIISIEINEKIYKHNIMKLLLNVSLLGQEFSSYKKDNLFVLEVAGAKITLVLGDTVEVLPSIVQNIKERTTFWLDAHWGPDIGSPLSGEEGAEILFPIYKEIEIISQHNIKNHKIMIDDMKQYEKYYSDNLDKLKNMFLNINQKYTFRKKSKTSDIDDYIFIAEVLDETQPIQNS